MCRPLPCTTCRGLRLSPPPPPPNVLFCSPPPLTKITTRQAAAKDAKYAADDTLKDAGHSTKVGVRGQGVGGGAGFRGACSRPRCIGGKPASGSLLLVNARLLLVCLSSKTSTQPNPEAATLFANA